MIDGRSRLMAHLTVTIPLIKGGLFATTMFIFILNWSEFMFALVLSYSNISTIPVQLAKYVTATAGDPLRRAGRPGRAGHDAPHHRGLPHPVAPGPGHDLRSH